MHRILSERNSRYMALKQALMPAYGKTLEEAQENLFFAPELGDKLLSEMLAQLGCQRC